MGKNKKRKAADEKKPPNEEIIKGEEMEDAEIQKRSFEEQAQDEKAPIFHMGLGEVPPNLPDESWSIEDLIKAALTDSHPLMRSNAVAALGHKRTPLVIETLVNALKDVDGIVKANAMAALAFFGDPVLDRMISALEDDPDPDVRAGAAYVLGELKDTRSIPALEKAAEDESMVVRVHAKASLIAMRSQKSEEDT